MFSTVSMLVVTDDASLLKVALEALFSLEIDPKAASDTRTARERIEFEHFDAVLIDAAVAPPNDKHPAVRIRRSRQNSKTHLVLLAGAEDYNVLPAIDLTVSTTVVEKPLRRNRLVAALRAIPALRIEERRRFIRLPIGMDVYCHEGPRTIFGRSLDLSEFGMLIESDAAPDESHQVTMQFILPGEGHPVEVRGVVVRQIEGRFAGIQFTLVEPDASRLIRDYVASHLNAD